jgi:hypothetical protein
MAKFFLVAPRQRHYCAADPNPLALAWNGGAGRINYRAESRPAL